VEARELEVIDSLDMEGIPRVNDDIGSNRPQQLAAIAGLPQRRDILLGKIFRLPGPGVVAVGGLQAEASGPQLAQPFFRALESGLVHFGAQLHGPAHAPARRVLHLLVALLS
jgi:hypothetical protein